MKRSYYGSNDMTKFGHLASRLNPDGSALNRYIDICNLLLWLPSTLWCISIQVIDHAHFQEKPAFRKGCILMLVHVPLLPCSTSWDVCEYIKSTHWHWRGMREQGMVKSNLVTFPWVMTLPSENAYRVHANGMVSRFPSRFPLIAMFDASATEVLSM